MLVLVVGVIISIFLYFWAIKVVASRIRWHFDIGDLVDFDRELKGRYIDFITKMAILGMFSQKMITIHGFSGNVRQATARVFSGENFIFKCLS